ncbi:unnamed protein product [Candidula unifasciata]|uniref:TIR domain-containing protein n=1 Tax=Candidula unifasciata TaxID=100452 RepID=A0A8S3ZQ31_9EUPU|nr:unnamed protein product [Candidula unifasciata]
MKHISLLLIAAACAVQSVSEDADDACWINQCQCSRNSYAPYNDVTCLVSSISSSDDTITALPAGVRSLTLTCSSPSWLSFLPVGIFEKFSNLSSLIVEQCNIVTLSAESFRGLASLTNLSIYESVLPTFHEDTFMHVPNLQHICIVYCNISILPDISHLKSLISLNVSHNKINHIEVASQSASGKEANLTKIASGYEMNLSEDAPRKGTNLSERDSTDSSKRNDFTELRMLDLSFNTMSSLPVSLLERTPYLQELYLTGLSLTHFVIPESIRLKDLIFLDAGQNPLQVVDFHRSALTRHRGTPLSCDGLSNLVNLEELALNSFSGKKKKNSTVLARLNLINNSLTTVDIGALPTLRNLHLSKNRISHLSSLTFTNQLNLLLVNFSDNQIQTLPSDLFQNNHHIVAIDFAGNRLERLENGTFSSLNELSYLDLKNNLLSYLPSTLFKDLSSMMYLYLSGNRINSLPELSYMTGLYTLEVSNNQLSTLEPRQLAGLDRLGSLLMNDNKLKVIPPNLFIECPSLLQVYLHNNQISDLGSLGTHPKLAILTLDNNQLTNFIVESPFISLRNLQYLMLNSNNITRLQANTFPSSIVTLFLDRNNIQVIDHGTFEGLSRLSYLSLRGNAVVLSIPLNVVNVFKTNAPKPTLHIEGNVLLCDCQLSYLKIIAENATSFPVFAMYYPQFIGLDNSYCYTPYWGEVFRPFTQVPLSQFVCDYTETLCGFNCDCCYQNTSCDCLVTCPSECKCIEGGSGFTRIYISILCSNSNLRQVPYGIPSTTALLYLDGNKLSHLSKQNFSYFRETEELYLNNSAIQSIDMGTFDDIPKLKILLLNDNLLTTIPENLFGNISELKEIYLHNNLINSVSPVAFSSLPSIETITLHNNKLVLLTSVPQLPHQLSLTLSGNPWSCDCNVIKVTLRVIYKLSQVIKDDDKLCCLVYNDTHHNLSDTDVHSQTSPGANESATISTVGSAREDSVGMLSDEIKLPTSSNLSKSCFSLLRFNYEDYCRPIVSNSSILIPVANSGLQPGFIALIVITISLFLVAFAVIFVLWKRREIQAWVFVKTGVRVLDKKAKLDKEDAGSKVFDAFISHSSADVGFVAGTLAPALEQGHRKYRLCIHYRDFPVGRNITDTICRAIENSSRTVLILSVHFLNSEWCRFEFQTAHHHILSQGNHRLIIILLEDIPENLLDPDLKVHMKSNTYLKYGDPWFWEKFYFAMPSIKDRPDDNEAQRLDVLHGMRLLAGDDGVEEDAHVDNQDNEIRFEFGMDLFDQPRMRDLQDHENGTEDNSSNCHHKPAENPVIKTLQYMAARLTGNDVDAVIDSFSEVPGDKECVGNNNVCLADSLGSFSVDRVFCPEKKHLPGTLDFLSDPDYCVDTNSTNCRDRNRHPSKSSIYSLNDEAKVKFDRTVDVRRTSSVMEEEKDDGNPNIYRNDSRCRETLGCQDDDEDETCLHTIYD